MSSERTKAAHSVRAGPPVVEPARDSRGLDLAAKDTVRRNGDHYLVVPPSPAESPPAFKVWRESEGLVRCSCADYEERGDPLFRCEHILAVKHYLLAKPVREYRKPDGALRARSPGRDPTASAYEGNQRVVKLRLVTAAAAVVKLLGHEQSVSATYRLGMPEALLEALEGCGDAEAARFACETFLERYGGRNSDAQPAPFLRGSEQPAYGLGAS